MGVPVMGGQFISYEDVQKSMTTPMASTELLSLSLFRAESYSASKDTLWIQYTPKDVSYSMEGFKWYYKTLDVLDHVDIKQDFDIYLQGGTAHIFAMLKNFLSLVPYMVLSSLLMVFILTGIFYRSVVAPLRSVVCISLTLVFVVGFAVMVYQEGVLDFLGFPGLQKAGSIGWTALGICLAIIIGMCLFIHLSRCLLYETLPAP